MTARLAAVVLLSSLLVGCAATVVIDHTGRVTDICTRIGFKPPKCP
jgi:hypothetical protein